MWCTWECKGCINKKKKKEAQIKQTKLSNVRCVQKCGISKYQGCIEKKNKDSPTQIIEVQRLKMGGAWGKSGSET